MIYLYYGELLDTYLYFYYTYLALCTDGLFKNMFKKNCTMRKYESFGIVDN